MALHVDDTEPDAGGETEAKDQNLQYYIDHPEEMPDDPALLERLGEGEDPGAGDPETPTIDLRATNQDANRGDEVTLGADMPKGEAAAETPPADDDAEAKAKLEAATAEAAQTPTDEELPVQAADGKHTLPYEVLKGTRNELAQTRDQLSQSQEQLAEKEKELERLTDQLRAAQAAKASAGDTPSQAASDAVDSLETDAPDFEVLRQEFPEELVNALERTTKLATHLQAKVNDLETQAQTYGEEERRAIAADSQAAVDRNAILAYWQANHPEVYAKARETDNFLQTQKEWDERSLDDRFAKVVEIVQSIVPDAPKPPPSKADQAKETERKAQARLEQAGSTAPTSHSDIPGGAPPPQSELEAADAMSVVQLEREFEGLDPEAQEAWLAKHGA